MSCASPVRAEVTGSIYCAMFGKYLWRGQLLSDTYAVQPGASLTYRSFTFDAWFSHQQYTELDEVTSQERTHRGLCEKDFTFTYESSLPWSEALAFKGGLITYILRTQNKAQEDSEEFFAGLSADAALAPYLTLYYDGALAKGAYLEAGAAKTLSLNNRLGVSLRLNAGYNFGQYEYKPSLTAVALCAGVDFTVGRFTITPGIIGQLPLDAQYEALACGSISINYDFTLQRGRGAGSVGAGKN
jgi:hypothetical protein